MANLRDDLILKIIVRLPLKYVIQCLLLNKKFYRLIFEPNFERRYNDLLSCSLPSSIFCYSRNILTKIIPESNDVVGSISQVPTTLTFQPSILASCNGVLLLHFFHRNSYYVYVFNPMTGGIMFVDYQLHEKDDVGLVVDLNAQKFHFKLVPVVVLESERIVRFSVIVPTSRGVVVKSGVDFVSRSYIRIRRRPVYVHGCLHWLEIQGKEIIAFDVEKERTRIMNGPVKNNNLGFDPTTYNWFGFADGSLQFVYTLQKDIIIQSHNYLEDEWQVKHKIATMCIPNNNDLIRNDTPLFFDGQRLFLKLHRRREYGVVVVHDIMSDNWEKIGKFEECRGFFSFFPTIAKVSDKYLENYKTEFPSSGSFGKLHYAEIKSSFEALQHLMT